MKASVIRSLAPRQGIRSARAPRPTPGRSPSNEGRDAACWVPLLAPAPGRLTSGRVPGAPVPPAAHHRRQEHSPVLIAGTLPGRGGAGRGLLQPVRALAGQAGSDECRAGNGRRGACRQRPAGGAFRHSCGLCASDQTSAPLIPGQGRDEHPAPAASPAARGAARHGPEVAGPTVQ